MNKISEMIEKYDLPPELVEQSNIHRQMVVADIDVRAFVEQNQLTHEDILKWFSLFSNFVTNKQSDKPNKQVLRYQDGVVDIAEFLDPEQQKRIEDKVSTAFITDSQTERLRGLSFDDVEVDDLNRSIVTAFKRLVDGYSYKGQSVGIWLHGQFGRGKTYLLGVLANELHRKGAGVTLVSPNTFISGAYSAMNQQKTHVGASPLEAYINKFANAEVLILDDMGTEHLSEYGTKILYEMMAKRYDRGKLTFASSNLTIDEYTEFLIKSNAMDANRLQERLRLLCSQVKLDGSNRRTK